MCRWLSQTFDHGSQSKKRALLVGIRYSGDSYLQGSIRDIQKVSYILRTKYDYENEDLLVLTDSDKTGIKHVTHKAATRESIIECMKCLMSNISSRERLFFYFAGHGTRVKAELMPVIRKVIESDGMDESILPQDYPKAEPILDDTLCELLVEPLPETAHLTAMFDCCHSGTILDLPLFYDPDNDGTKIMMNPNLMKNNNIIDEVGEILSVVSNDIKRGKFVRAFESASGFVNKHKVGSEFDKPEIDMEVGNVMCISACKDEERSIQTSELGIANGAITDALMNRLLDTTNLTWENVLYFLRDKVVEHNQTPQLSMSRPINIKSRFEL